MLETGSVELMCVLHSSCMVGEVSQRMQQDGKLRQLYHRYGVYR